MLLKPPVEVELHAPQGLWPQRLHTVPTLSDEPHSQQTHVGKNAIGFIAEIVVSLGFCVLG